MRNVILLTLNTSIIVKKMMQTYLNAGVVIHFIIENHFLNTRIKKTVFDYSNSVIVSL